MTPFWKSEISFESWRYGNPEQFNDWWRALPENERKHYEGAMDRLREAFLHGFPSIAPTERKPTLTLIRGGKR